MPIGDFDFSGYYRSVPFDWYVPQKPHMLPGEVISTPTGWPGPFKCPDCKVWWVGFYHKCATLSTSIDWHNSTVWSVNADDVSGDKVTFMEGPAV